MYEAVVPLNTGVASNIILLPTLVHVFAGAYRHNLPRPSGQPSPHWHAELALVRTSCIQNAQRDSVVLCVSPTDPAPHPPIRPPTRKTSAPRLRITFAIASLLEIGTSSWIFQTFETIPTRPNTLIVLMSSHRVAAPHTHVWRYVRTHPIIQTHMHAVVLQGRPDHGSVDRHFVVFGEDVHIHVRLHFPARGACVQSQIAVG